MGTEKRQRQKDRRAARIDEAVSAQESQARRRRMTMIGVFVAVAALVLVGVFVLTGDDDDTDVATGGDEAPVAGGDCVGLTDELPEGAPSFEVPTGPPPTELVIEDLVVGEGEEAQPGDTVEAHYVGVACSTGVVFDSSYSRGEPTSFPLDGVIAGWSEGIPGMRVGGQRLLVIPSELAYGEMGSGADIGPNEPLTFFVELTGVQSSGQAPEEDEPVALGSTECPPEENLSPPQLAFDGIPPVCIDPDAEYEAVFTTNQGEIRVALDTETMPQTVNNFVVLSRYGYYDGTEIFRTDPSIGIVQGGAPNTNSPADPGPGYTIGDEGGDFDFSGPGGGSGPFTYEPGQLVMARSAGPNSSGAQFFFTITDAAAALDAQGTYLVFGQVTEGLDVLEAILDSHEPDPTSSLGGGPAETVLVESVRIETV